MSNQYTKKIDTETELRVIDLFSKGKTAKQIAYDLGLTVWKVYELRDIFPLLCIRKKDV